MGRSYESKCTVKFANPTFALTSYLQISEALVFKGSKIALHTFEANLNQIELIYLGF